MKPRPVYVLMLAICVLLLVYTSSQIYPPERNNTGNSLYAEQDNASALSAYQLAQVNAPDQWEYYYNAASVLVETGRLRAAVAALEQALETDDNALKTQAHYNLGHVHYQLGRYTDAAASFQAVLRHTPDDEDARYNYELALAQLQPTPTPQEQQTNPEEDETNPESTPTSNPADQDSFTPTVTLESTPTPTSPPDNSNPPQPNADGTTNGGETEGNEDLDSASDGPLSLGDVERQFDAIQDAQQTLRQALENTAAPERPNEKDW